MITSGVVRTGLRGRHTLVTGGARGLGAAISRRPARARASVTVADVRRDLAEKLCAGLTGEGHEAAFTLLGVRDADAVAELFGDLDKRVRPVDVLVNNAAVGVSRLIEHLTAELSVPPGSSVPELVVPRSEPSWS